ncbi:hypothetical protein BH20ACT19_BH20ACT19_06340 [soil metagenome]
MRVEREIEIAASREAIYEVVMDAGRLEDWVSIHQELLDAPDGQLRKGSKLSQCLTLAGRPIKVHWTVVENDRPTRVVWEGRGPVRSKAKVIYELRESDGGTHFSYANEYDLPGGPFGRIAGPVVRRVTAGELDDSLENLRKLVE